jgi:hypothetical protein
MKTRRDINAPHRIDHRNDCVFLLFKSAGYDAYAADLHYISPAVSIHIVCPVPAESPKNV